MNKALKTILLIALLAAFISTVSYCSAPFDTETARLISVRKTIGGHGYILRRETTVDSSPQSVFEPTVQDGVRVARESSIGISISGNYSKELVKKHAEVTERIEEIKKSGNIADIYTSDQARVYSALKDITAQIRKNAQNENYVEAAEDALQLNTILEKKYSSENKGAATELLASLEKEKLELESQLGSVREEVKAPSSGYFFTALDGLENYNYEDKILSILPAEIQVFPDTIKNYTPSGDYVGKVVGTYSWYLVANIPPEEAELLEVGSRVSLSVDESVPVSAVVAAINTDNTKNTAVVIKCTRNVNDVFEKRSVDFEICYKESSGLYVPSAAIRIKDNVKGVYVINENEVVSFRCVDILLQEKDFYVVRNGYTPPEDVEYSPLKLYDKILVNPEAVRIDEHKK